MEYGRSCDGVEDDICWPCLAKKDLVLVLLVALRRSSRHFSAAKEFVFSLLYSGRFSKNSLTDKCANRNVSNVESKMIMLAHMSKTCSLVKSLNFLAAVIDSAARNSADRNGL